MESRALCKVGGIWGSRRGLRWAESGVVGGTGGYPDDRYSQLFRLGQRGRRGMRRTSHPSWDPPSHLCTCLAANTASIYPRGGMQNGPGAGDSWPSRQVALRPSSSGRNDPSPTIPLSSIPVRDVQEALGPWMAKLLLSGIWSGSFPATPHLGAPPEEPSVPF